MTDTFYTVTPSGVAVAADLGDTVIALGSFDGVHAAHHALIGETLSLGRKLGVKTGVWCFSTLPANSLRKEKLPMLCSLDEKIELLLSLGLDFVAVGDFSQLCSYSPEDFIENVLKKELNCIGCACGFNHRFGKGGVGSPETLVRAFGEENTVIMPEFTLLSKTVSSTVIRELISAGDVSSAAVMLKRSYSLKGEVLQGKHLGRKLGFPTANQRFPDGIAVPKYGIYATLCTTADGKKHAAVSNIGIRPTIIDGSDTHAVNCETYIHDFNQNIYGEILTVEFCEYLREEKKFDSVESLRQQISRDLEGSLSYFERSGSLI